MGKFSLLNLYIALKWVKKRKCFSYILRGKIEILKCIDMFQKKDHCSDIYIYIYIWFGSLVFLSYVSYIGMEKPRNLQSCV